MGMRFSGFSQGYMVTIIYTHVHTHTHTHIYIYIYIYIYRDDRVSMGPCAGNV